MTPIRYKAKIVYDFDSIIEYKIFADTKDNAYNIAEELFLIQEGVCPDKVVTVTPMVVDSKEESTIDNLLIGVLKELSKVIETISYPEFLDLFLKFDGKNLKLGDNPSFVFTFLGFTLKMYIENHEVKISRDEILYIDEVGRLFVIRNGIIYIGY